MTLVDHFVVVNDVLTDIRRYCKTGFEPGTRPLNLHIGQYCKLTSGLLI